MVVAGLAKIRAPERTAKALRAIGVPATSWIVRALGFAEVALGGIAALRPTSEVLVALGALFIAFAVFVAFLLSRGGPDPECGCFGGHEMPASGLHIGVNIAAALVSLVAATNAPPGFLDLVLTRPSGLILALLTALGVYLVTAVFTYLPGALRAYQRRPRTPARRADSAPKIVSPPVAAR